MQSTKPKTAISLIEGDFTMRFDLCCLFKEEPVAFRTTTAKELATVLLITELKKIDDQY